MKRNTPDQVKNEIAATQDGGILTSDRFSDFINECIDYNTDGYSGDNTKRVSVEDLIDDFNYMIDQLKKAIVPLKELAD